MLGKAMFAQWQDQGKYMRRRLRPVAGFVGVILYLASLVFNVLALTPLFLRPDPVRQLQAILAKSEPVGLVQIGIVIITALGFAFCISYFEVAGRARFDQELWRLTMFAAYAIGIFMNFAGMLFIGPLGEDLSESIFVLIVLIIAAVVLEIAPEFLIIDAFGPSYSENSNSGESHELRGIMVPSTTNPGAAMLQALAQEVVDGTGADTEGGPQSGYRFKHGTDSRELSCGSPGCGRFVHDLYSIEDKQDRLLGLYVACHEHKTLVYNNPVTVLRTWRRFV